MDKFCLLFSFVLIWFIFTFYIYINIINDKNNNIINHNINKENTKNINTDNNRSNNNNINTDNSIDHSKNMDNINISSDYTLNNNEMSYDYSQNDNSNYHTLNKSLYNTNGGEIIIDVMWAGLFNGYSTNTSWYKKNDFGGSIVVSFVNLETNQVCVSNPETNEEICDDRYSCESDPPKDDQKLKQCLNFIDLAKGYQLTKQLLNRPKDLNHWLMFLDDDSIPCKGYEFYLYGIKHWIAVNLHDNFISCLRIGRGNSGVLLPYFTGDYFEDYLLSIINTGVTGDSIWENKQQDHMAFDSLISFVYAPVMEELNLGKYYNFQLNLIDHLPDYNDILSTTQGWDQEILETRLRKAPRCLEALGDVEIETFFNTRCAGYLISPCNIPDVIPWQIGYPLVRNYSTKHVEKIEQISFVKGFSSESCSQACFRIGQTCNVNGRYIINDCRSVQRLFGEYPIECIHGVYRFTPAYLPQSNIALLSNWDEQLSGEVHPFHKIDNWCDEPPEMRIEYSYDEEIERFCTCSGKITLLTHIRLLLQPIVTTGNILIIISIIICCFIYGYIIRKLFYAFKPVLNEL